MIKITEVDKFIAAHKQDKELWKKVSEMVTKVITDASTELSDVKYKFTDGSKLSDDAVKEILREQGFNYITEVMDTITGFQFNVMTSFMDLINQLKGTRKGMELVLRLMGFDSIIKEWWQDTLVDRSPWSYEIIIIVNSSLVPDIYNTIDKVKLFSENYVIAKISNIDVRFSAPKFAERGAIMGGFIQPTYFGSIVQRV